jgi:cardiolipin synthase
MPLNVPNILTWLRIIMIPMLVGIFYVPDGWISPFTRNVTATTLFTAAALTDWLDGYLARTLNQLSAFGEFLDPVADKLMVAAALVLLVGLGRVDALIAFVIIGREIAISALREWMAKIGRSRSVAVSMIGKVKTVSQMVAIPLLLYHMPLGPMDSALVGTVLLLLAAFLTLLSMGYYLRLALPHLSD